MTKLFAMFASVILVINISACTMQKEEKAVETSGSGSVPQKSTQSMSIQAAQNTAKSAVPATPSGEPSPANTSVIIDNKSITIIPQQDNKIIITYPKYEINQCDILPSDQSYTLTLTPGEYSDPQNAITTFLFDLYMKQSLCFENIHRDIEIEPSNQAFVDTLYTMESLILNLGQVDVLVLPKFKYHADGVPYIFQNAAAYKTTENETIRFGNTCENDEFKQVAKGSFDSGKLVLYLESATTMPDNQRNLTYFEAMKTKDDIFIYRIMNIVKGHIQSLFITVSDELMQAGFSEGAAPDNFVITPLPQTPTLKSSDEKISLTPVFSLFANEDGAIIPLENENK